MRLGLIIIVTGFALCLFSCRSEVKNMSTEEKIQDFEFLYQTLKENYPFFGIMQREYGINWLEKKDVYLNRIKSTPNDSAYFFVLQSIIWEAGSMHLGIGPTIENNFFTEIYKRVAIEKSKYQKWVDVLEHKSERSDHWLKIWNNKWGKIIENKSKAEVGITNYVDSILIDDNIAVMRFNNSFVYDNFTKDTTAIVSFLDKIKDLKYLIIDIQDNGGGSDNSWKYLVSKMIKAPITFVKHQVIKDGTLNRYFYPEIFENGSIAVKNENLPNIPDEILDGSFYIYSWMDTIYPDNSALFNGKIFLLVNEKVVSSSESFTYLCKISQWATVAGVTTMGDGNCGEPTLFMLPNSGIILNHPSLVGLNGDGSINYEMKTVPDLYIEGNNINERLNNLIDFIRKENRFFK